jgi:hypothetical protein
MADMPQAQGPDMSIMIFGALIIVGGVLIWYFMKNRKPKDFKPKPFKEQNFAELMNMLKRNGTKCRGGKLHIGFHRVAHVTRFLEAAGKFNAMVYDAKKRNFRPAKPDEGSDKKFDIVLFRAHPQNFFLRQLNKIFQMWHDVYVIDNTTMRPYDPDGNRFFLKQNEFMISYGGVWCNDSKDTQEFINDLALKRITEETLTMAENLGPRLMYLETITARHVTRLSAEAKSTKEKYDSLKTADDTQLIV